MAGAKELFAFAPERARQLAAQHGTPCFVYDARRSERAFRELAAALPPRVALAFAVKANPHPMLLARLAACGARFDCASAGELQRASAALDGSLVTGTDGRVAAAEAIGDGARAPHAARSAVVASRPARDAPQRVPAGATRDVLPRLLYAGPGKRDAEIALALSLGARLQAEGLEDLQRVDALARAARGGAPIDVNLRVHPRLAPTEERALLGGSGPSAFGVDEEDLPELLARAAALRGVRIAGLHVFAATNQRDASALLAAWEHVFSLGAALQRDHGLSLAQIDLGGGLGVPYAAGESPLDVRALGAGLAALLARHAWFAGEVLLEPGRYLAASCGDYLVRVVRTKHSRGTRFAILEGGINHLLRPLLTGQPFPVRLAAAAPDSAGHATLARDGQSAHDTHIAHDGALHATVLAGPLCTALDRLGDVLLPALSPGDLLQFGMVGAYGATEAMGEFLSHPRPPEIWVDANDAG
jgi:diaminopimelate decarboxylase